MTGDDRLFLDELKANTSKLFLMAGELEEEKKLLQAQMVKMEEEIQTLKQEKEEQSRVIESLRVANHILSGKDENREAKKKIYKIVREIDKCIALLNK